MSKALRFWHACPSWLQPMLPVWMGLCMAMAAASPLAHAGQVTHRGTVLASEIGVLLETEQGDFFMLQGIDARTFMDAKVVVTGEAGEDELGNDVIVVRTIREEKLSTLGTVDHPLVRKERGGLVSRP
jgi:hypothetical protein